MALPKDKVSISVVIDREVKEELDRIAEMFDISVSKLARNMMYVGLDNFKILRRLGFVHIVNGLDRFTAICKTLLNPNGKDEEKK